MMKMGFYFLSPLAAGPSGPFETYEAAVSASELPVIAQDWAAQESGRYYDADGRLHVRRSHITKANVCEYKGSEIPDFVILGLDANKKYKLLRDPEELQKAAHTFTQLPILNRHVPVTAFDPNSHQPGLVIGAIGSTPEWADPYIDNELVIWARDPIDDVEQEIRTELSSAYRYRADMTPGTFKGEAFDGVMRDIRGNHVALVREGRAGSDVVVGDSKENDDMSKKVVLSRRGAVLRGALYASLRPVLAQDAKLDLTAICAPVTSKNFTAMKPTIIAAVSKVALAQDAKLPDLVGLLDAMEKDDVAEGVDADPSTGLPMAAMPEANDADDAGLMQKICALLEGKVDPALLAQVQALETETTMDAETDDDDDKEADKDKDDMKKKKKPPAFDFEAPAKKPEMVTKTAMDEALKAHGKSIVDQQRQTREAEKAVRPYVGDLAMAHDSADEVYRTALTSLNVDVTDVHPSAFPALLKAQPLPGKRNAVPVMAQDAASAKSFSDRYPSAAKIRQL